MGDGNYLEYGALSYNNLTNEITGAAKNTGVRRTDGYFKAPGTGKVNIFNMAAMNAGSGTIEPYGVNGLIPGTSWRMERNNTTDITVQYDYDRHSSYKINEYGAIMAVGSSRNCNAYWFHSATNNLPAGWRKVRVKMPQPFVSTDFIIKTTSNAWAQIQGFYVRATNTYDESAWPVIAGIENKIETTPWPNCSDYIIPNNSKYPYLWYEFNIYYHNSDWKMLTDLGPIDATPGGHPDNHWYYYSNSVYSDVTGTQNQYPSNSPMPFSYKEGAPTNKSLVSSSTYPNGLTPFYIMKHELSQHAYVDFLNSLTIGQQGERCGDAKPVSPINTLFNQNVNACRNYVSVWKPSTGGPAEYGCNKKGAPTNQWLAELQGGNVAMCYLNWADNAAYLCWAGLRPLTELEYEKACRGSNPAVKKEFAWGTTNAIPHTGISNANAYNELVLPSYANFIQYKGVMDKDIFPARVGCLATATSTRTDAGASFYGVLNLSDNVSEIYINVSTPEGLKFNGEHGSGNLNGNGDANIISWPEVSSTSATGAVGTGIRGVLVGFSTYTTAPVSSRIYAEGELFTKEKNMYLIGCRGGRTAPKGKVY